MAQYSRSERRKKENAELSHTPIRKEEPRKPLPKARTSKKIARGAKKGFSALQKLVAIAAGLVTILGALGIFAITRNGSSKSNNDSNPSSSVVKSSENNQSSTDTQNSSSDANADQNQDGQSDDQSQSQSQDQSQDGQTTDSQSQDQSQGDQGTQGADQGKTGGVANQTPQQ